jgi:hypothetical protein
MFRLSLWLGVSCFARHWRHAFRLRSRWHSGLEQVRWRSPARGWGSNHLPHTRHGRFFGMAPSREPRSHGLHPRGFTEEQVAIDLWLDLHEQPPVDFW